MNMANPPKELTQQIELLRSAISSVNVILDDNKVKVEYYGKDFLKPLAEIRKKALDLRSDLESFINVLEDTIESQYAEKPVPSRFASARNVIDGFLNSRS